MTPQVQLQDGALKIHSRSMHCYIYGFSFAKSMMPYVQLKDEALKTVPDLCTVIHLLYLLSFVLLDL